MSFFDFIVLTILPLAIVGKLRGVAKIESDEARAIEAARRRGEEIRRAYWGGFRFGLEEGEYRASKKLTPERYTIGEWFFALRDGRVAMRLK